MNSFHASLIDQYLQLSTNLPINLIPQLTLSGSFATNSSFAISSRAFHCQSHRHVFLQISDRLSIDHASFKNVLSNIYCDHCCTTDIQADQNHRIPFLNVRMTGSITLLTIFQTLEDPKNGVTHRSCACSHILDFAVALSVTSLTGAHFSFKDF